MTDWRLALRPDLIDLHNVRFWPKPAAQTFWARMSATDPKRTLRAHWNNSAQVQGFGGFVVLFVGIAQMDLARSR